MKKERIIMLRWIMGLLVILSFLMLFTYNFSSGGCYSQAKISEIKNPNNINIELKSKSCNAGAEIIFKDEESLTINYIEVIKKEGEMTKICDNRAWSVITLENGSKEKFCRPISLSKGNYHDPFYSYGNWKIVTDKGNISGKMEIYDTTIVPSYTFLGIFVICLVIFIYSFFIKEKK